MHIIYIHACAHTYTHIYTQIRGHTHMTLIHTCIVNKIQHITNIHIYMYTVYYIDMDTHTSIETTHIANRWNEISIMIAIIFVTAICL